MNRELLTFLRPFKRPDNSLSPTHTSVFPPYGSFNIEGQKLDDFINLYCDLLHNSASPNCAVSKDSNNFISGIAEMSEKNSTSVIVDVDLKVKIEEKMNLEKKLYDDRHILKIIQIYQQAITEIVDNVQPHHLYAIVLEKTKPKILDKEHLKNGFHIHFFNTYFSMADYDVYLAPKILKLVEEANVFGDIKLVQTEKAMDVGVVKAPILLYGSRKGIDLESYKVTKVYDDKLQLSDLDTLLQKSNYKYLRFDGTELKIDTHKPSSYYLPRILSAKTLGRSLVKIKTGTICELKAKPLKTIIMQRKREGAKTTYSRKDILKNIDTARKLLPLLHSSRADHYKSWMEVGLVLYSIGEGSEEAFNLWNLFSQKTSRGNYKETECRRFWSTMKKYNYSLGSLKYFAETDSPKEYQDFQLSQITNNIKGIRNSNVYIAEILYELYGNKFICADIKKKIWYHYENHSWNITQYGRKLHLKLSSLRKTLSKYLSGLSEGKSCKLDLQKNSDDDEESEDEEEPADEEEIKKIRKKIIGILTNLEKTSFCNNVMTECALLFSKDENKIEFNNNPKYIGFQNGVYDFEEGRFRPGRPEDYITYKVDYNYEEFDEDSEQWISLENCLIKTFTDPELRRYFLEYCSDLLVGGNYRKIMMVWTADGNNAKSATVKLLEYVFGPYICKIPTGVITNKRGDAAAASPQLARTKGKRITIAQEPDKKETINVGMVKEMTGNDSMYLRGLYEEGDEIQLLFKLILISNALPRVPTGDQAFWDRIRVLPFESKFVDPELCPETFEEQLKKKVFPKDPEFYNKVKELRVIFMFRLIKVWHEVQKNGYMPEPLKVKNETKQYMDNNDYVLQFINSQLVHDGKTVLHFRDVYHAYMDWLKETTDSKSRPSEDEKQIKENFKAKWGEPENNCWKGYKLKTLEDEEKEGNVLVPQTKIFD